MKFTDLVNALTPERYDVLKRAVELGKWPDGRVLGQEERETSLKILIAYDVTHKPENERIGFVPKKDCEHEDEHVSPLLKNIIVKN